MNTYSIIQQELLLNVQRRKKKRRPNVLYLADDAPFTAMELLIIQVLGEQPYARNAYRKALNLRRFPDKQRSFIYERYPEIKERIQKYAQSSTSKDKGQKQRREHEPAGIKDTNANIRTIGIVGIINRELKTREDIPPERRALLTAYRDAILTHCEDLGVTYPNHLKIIQLTPHEEDEKL